MSSDVHEMLKGAAAAKRDIAEALEPVRRRHDEAHFSVGLLDYAVSFARDRKVSVRNIANIIGHLYHGLTTERAALEQFDETKATKQ